MDIEQRVSPARLHHAIVEFVVEHASVPAVADLSGLLNAPVSEIEDGLRRLQDDHGVVLHPGTSDIWVVHPFSLAPTTFVVRSGPRQWWAPCAWCALGVAAVLRRDVDVVTTLGADTTQVTLRIRDGRLVDDDYCVHFPVPMRRAWQNVIYTCSMMLLFRSDGDVDRWCRRRRIEKGDVRPVATVWRLAEAWYGRHRDPDWKKWTTEEAREIFAGLGLTGDIWALPGSDERF